MAVKIIRGGAIDGRYDYFDAFYQLRILILRYESCIMICG